MFEKVRTVVNEAEHISFSTDIWTSNSNISFISLTSHCLNLNCEQKTVVLRIRPFPGSHTTAHITEILLDKLQKFNKPTYKVHLFIRDSGANTVKCIEGTGHQRLSCFLHIVLVMHDSVSDERQVKDIITQCKQIVGHFNYSL